MGRRWGADGGNAMKRGLKRGGQMGPHDEKMLKKR